jgi:hypothetical protein
MGGQKFEHDEQVQQAALYVISCSSLEELDSWVYEARSVTEIMYLWGDYIEKWRILLRLYKVLIEIQSWNVLHDLRSG